MRVKYFKIVKPIAVMVLFFFLWTFGGLFDIAYAVSNSSNSSRSSNSLKAKDKRPEESFEEALEKIREAEEKAQEKLYKGEGTEAEENEIKTGKAEIEKHDKEIKKQFKDTEEKIKNLPKEIKQRHRDFVGKYEENLNTLKVTLDDIEKAKTRAEKEQAHRKTKEFLEKTKPPKKHKPLDPNKLPHRTAEPVLIEPRTTPEQFLNEGSQQTVDSSQGTAPLNLPLAKTTPLQFPPYQGGTEGGNDSPSRVTRRESRLLLASNGSLDGLVDSLPATPYTLHAAVAAQATNPPTSADLAETIEVQFTPEIRAKAQELGNNPVKIYNWVRNNIEYVPTYGSIQGANMCLQTKLCNDFDTASLLVALLRASGIHARYAYGTIEVPIEKVKNWLGGFTDSMAAMVRPESCIGSAGGSPDRVSAGAPGSRHRLKEEIS